jgi:hypothetical protein
MPSLTAQALNSALSTIGPFTVIDYLRFAYGEGIGPLQDGDLDPLVGLEHVAQLVKTEPADCTSTSNGSGNPAQDKVVECFSQNLEALSVEEQVHSSQTSSINGEGLPVEKEDPAELSPEFDGPSSIDETESDLSFSYGAVSDRIGEACVCWLARWGTDMLAYEQQVASAPKQATSFMPMSTPPRAIGRRSTASGWRSRNPDIFSSPPPKVPLIWRRGGLTAVWVRALVSSDLLFVKGEKERYDLAKAVVELRRGAGVLEDEEVEWTKMFSEGIYYANMVCPLAP